MDSGADLAIVDALRLASELRGMSMSDNNRPIIIQQISAPQPKWNKGIAGLLSFLIPGMGQIYKGKPIIGMGWFALTLVGYMLFIVPGVILHVMCVVAATMGDPNR